MNERSRPTAAPQKNVSARDPSMQLGRRWWEHPEDLPDDELMLVVRAIAAVDRAVDKHRRAA
jgi:hypothetical protein